MKARLNTRLIQDVMLQTHTRSVVTPRFVDGPVAVAKLLAQWSDRIASEQTTGTLYHLYATVDGA